MLLSGRVKHARGQNLDKSVERSKGKGESERTKRKEQIVEVLVLKVQ
jgi:hypothetical protein